MTAGELLIQKRLERGLSLREAVNAIQTEVNLKISAVYLSQLENDKVSFKKSETLNKLVAFYKIENDAWQAAIRSSKLEKAIVSLSIDEKKERLEAARIVINKFSNEEIQNILERNKK